MIGRPGERRHTKTLCKQNKFFLSPPDEIHLKSWCTTVQSTKVTLKICH